MSNVESLAELQLQKLAREHGDVVYMYAKSFRLVLDGLTQACTRTNDPQVKIIAAQVADDLLQLEQSMKERSHDNN